MRSNEAEHEGYVIKSFNNGIVVLVPKFGVEGLIKLETMGDVNSANYDEDKYELTFTDIKERREQLVFLTGSRWMSDRLKMN